MRCFIGIIRLLNTLLGTLIIRFMGTLIIRLLNTLLRTLIIRLYGDFTGDFVHKTFEDFFVVLYRYIVIFCYL